MNLKDFIGCVRDAFIIVGAFLYFVGYNFRQAYLHSLNVPPNATQSGPNDLIIYSMTVMGYEWLPLLGLAAVVAIVYAAFLIISNQQECPSAFRRRALLGLTAVITNQASMDLLFSQAGVSAPHNTKSLEVIDLKTGKAVDETTVKRRLMTLNASKPNVILSTETVIR